MDILIYPPADRSLTAADKRFLDDLIEKKVEELEGDHGMRCSSSWGLYSMAARKALNDAKSFKSEIDFEIASCTASRWCERYLLSIEMPVITDFSGPEEIAQWEEKFSKLPNKYSFLRVYSNTVGSLYSDLLEHKGSGMTLEYMFDDLVCLMEDVRGGEFDIHELFPPEYFARLDTPE